MSVKSIFAVIFLLSLNVKAQLPANYQSLSAEEKFEILQENILSNQWEVLPPLKNRGWGSIVSDLRSLVSLSKTFDHISDEVPEGRTKFIHTYGSVGSIEWVSSGNHRYTGLFQSGTIGFIRASLASSPEAIEYTPGVAIKLLIDGKPSANILAMNSLNGQASANFFEKVFSTRIPEPQGIALNLLKKIFEFVKKPATELPLGHLAIVDKKGIHIGEKSNAPFALHFVPRPKVTRIIHPRSARDFRLDLADIPLGPLYEVYAQDEYRRDATHIGTIHLTSELLSSEYGDKKLFFQHNKL